MDLAAFQKFINENRNLIGSDVFNSIQTQIEKKSLREDAMTYMVREIEKAKKVLEITRDMDKKGGKIYGKYIEKLKLLKQKAKSKFREMFKTKEVASRAKDSGEAENLISNL